MLCDKQWGMVKMNQPFTLRPFKTMLLKSLAPEENITTELGEIEFDKLASPWARTASACPIRRS